MAIPESQLITWSGIGAETNSTRTYDSVKVALDGVVLPAGKFKDVYLQGSYRNKTNIYGDSDVDIVVSLRDTWMGDISALPAHEVTNYRSNTSDANYDLADFRGDVIKGLRSYFTKPGAVIPGPKAVAIQTPYLKADVIIAIETRKYNSFLASPGNYIEGITFQIQGTTDWVENYPILHYNNCVNKHASTNEWFKPVVRIFKNARSRMISDGTLGPKDAPSCFVECLVYNVPDNQFGTSYVQTFCNVGNWLEIYGTANLRFAHGRRDLIGAGLGQFSQTQFNTFIRQLKVLWNGWP